MVIGGGTASMPTIHRLHRLAIPILLLLLLTIAAPQAYAQLTTVTAVVADPNGNLYQNGTWQANLIVPPGANNIPTYGSGPGTAFGTVVPLTQQGTMDSFGSFTTTLSDNNVVTPTGTTWNFSFCSNRYLTLNVPICFTLNGQTITGASVNLSSAIQAVAAPISFTGSTGNANTWSKLQTFTGGVLGSTPGVFTNTQMNQPFNFVTNGCNAQTEFNRVGATHATDGLATCFAVPSSSVVSQSNGLGIYANTSSTTTNTVGLYAQNISLANNTVTHWGANVVCSDDGSRTAGQSCIGIEVDVGQLSPVSAYTGLFGVTAVAAGAGGPGIVAGSTGFLSGANAANRQWDLGFATQDNVVVGSAAFQAGAECLSGSCTSQLFRFKSMGAGVGVYSNVFSDSSGNVNMTLPTGQGFRAPVHFCNEAAAPPNYGVGIDQLWCDSVFHRLAMFNNGGVKLQIAGMLTGITGTITGTALTATCDSGTVSVTGAAVGSPVTVSTTDGTDIGGAFNIRGSVTSSGTVTVYVCGTGTPGSKAYNVAVIQ
jgi:hypothetical protein